VPLFSRFFFRPFATLISLQILGRFVVSARSSRSLSFYIFFVDEFSFSATEVRCQEKTRGGLRYEVILSEPEVKVTPPKKAASPKNSMSVQDIEDKLKAAEERRQVIDGAMMGSRFLKYFNFMRARGRFFLIDRNERARFWT
jgi:hypothetical protein